MLKDLLRTYLNYLGVVYRSAGVSFAGKMTIWVLWGMATLFLVMGVIINLILLHVIVALLFLVALFTIAIPLYHYFATRFPL
jgi:hypothetical protein